MTSYNLRHTTHYDYEAPVMHAHHIAHLRPRSLPYQTIDSEEVLVTPGARSIDRGQDYFGNETDAIEVLEPHETLEVTAKTVVSVSERNLALTAAACRMSVAGVAAHVKGPGGDLLELEYCADSPLVRAHAILRDYSSEVLTPSRNLAEAVIHLNQKIYEDFKYESSVTDISTPLAQVLRERRGVCQDFAHVAIGCLRSFGLPARYVSGYLETIPPAGKPRLVGADASHAWAAVLLPGLGWLDFDPTNNLLPGERHITVGWGRDFSDVSPLKGVVLGGGAHRLSVAVDVEPRPAASDSRGPASEGPASGGPPSSAP